MAGGLMDLWNHWTIQILVLFSLLCQVVLLLCAGVRRREASHVGLFFLWLAYQLADSTATYAIGHLSLSSAPQEHKLVAFWAPFLLLHLGGPDNITAYALEDNKLWLRHFVTLVVQMLGAGYVLYKHIDRSGTLVMLAAVLMSVVGVVKYLERTWALWCSNFSSIRSSLKVPPRNNKHHPHFYTEHQGYLRVAQDNKGEFLLQCAHSLFHVCKSGIVASVIAVDSDNPDIKVMQDLLEDSKRMWMVMEMELSLMYDILYTKANVIHTCFGYCIRVVSPLAVVASLLLFLFSGKDDHSGVDVAITYVLLGGAFVLETKSLLSALGSSWAFAFLCAKRWSWLRHAPLCAGTSSSRRRRWSGTIGQYNMLRFSCTRQVDATSHRLDNLAKMLGCSEWWEKKYYSWTVAIPEVVKERAEEMHDVISPADLNTMGLLRHKWGDLALKGELREKLKDWHGVDFHESIIIWHIATDLFLSSSERAKEVDAAPRVEAIKKLSNYMMFLLVDRPYMLPGLPQEGLYQKTCSNLDDICRNNRQRFIDSSAGRTNVCTVLGTLFRALFRPHGDFLSSRLEQTKKELAEIILNSEWQQPDYTTTPRLPYARRIAEILKDAENAEDAVAVLFDLWIDFLAYAANRCSRESHAKKLSKGGEFTTVLWLMIEHLCQIKSALPS